MLRPALGDIRQRRAIYRYTTLYCTRDKAGMTVLKLYYRFLIFGCPSMHHAFYWFHSDTCCRCNSVSCRVVDDPAFLPSVALLETKNADLVLALCSTSSGIKVLTDMNYFNPLLKFYQNTPDSVLKLSSLLTLLRQHKTYVNKSRTNQSWLFCGNWTRSA